MDRHWNSDIKRHVDIGNLRYEQIEIEIDWYEQIWIDWNRLIHRYE